MTVIISLPHPQLIIMVTDSKKTLYYSEEPTYGTVTKNIPMQGIGGVTFWGDITRVELTFPQYLQANQQEIKTVEDLRSLVYRFLSEKLQPDPDGDSIGFHVGGFLPDGTPKLYHIFWGTNIPSIEGEVPDYHNYESESNLLATYNGRSDFIHPIMQLLVALQEQVGVPIFTDDQVQRILVVDFITRYISHLTPDVRGDIHIILIRPNNQVSYIRKRNNAIFLHNDLSEELRKILREP